MSEFGFREYRENSEGSDTALPQQPKKPLSSRQQEELINARGWGDTKRVNALLAQGVTFPESTLAVQAEQSKTESLAEPKPAETLSAREQRQIDDAAWGNYRPE